MPVTAYNADGLEHSLLHTMLHTQYMCTYVFISPHQYDFIINFKHKLCYQQITKLIHRRATVTLIRKTECSINDFVEHILQTR